MAGTFLSSSSNRKHSNSSQAPATKKFTVSKKTFQKYDKSLETIGWLDFETNADGESILLQV